MISATRNTNALVVIGDKHELILIEPHSGKILQSNELRESERTGDFPNLIIMLLPSDHTSGTQPRSPTPAAKVADNDLAVGQIVEAISHSKFWKDTCVFAIEDDPQNGFDHLQMNPELKTIKDPVQKQFAIAATKLPLDATDECPEDLFNRILWNAQKGSDAEYPAWAVTASENRTRGD